MKPTAEQLLSRMFMYTGTAVTHKKTILLETA